MIELILIIKFNQYEYMTIEVLFTVNLEISFLFLPTKWVKWIKLALARLLYLNIYQILLISLYLNWSLSIFLYYKLCLTDKLIEFDLQLTPLCEMLSVF